MTAGLDSAQVWLVIALLGAGSFGLRYLFLGLVGGRALPEWIIRHLRYTAVAVLPALVAPALAWPDATGGAPDPARLAAVAATLSVGVITRNLLVAILAGGAALYAGIYWF